ncbi:DUF2235 domain-containing protein [Tritonibacter scottomollicae]|uniref:DUF2235 domain-containing protein n=1 Tax=Tritonibacter scottomollicae TaxID=483013 RepID=A0ABZ0HLL5_TRISK|nr:DUF2235 domain-containing protein [Tritonibacter scottomollicae]WOI35181.1 DUF2235 domain-containing protein [Tritonibacter scottomollicae]
MSLGDIDKAAQAASSDAGLQGETGNLAQTCPKTVLEVGVFFDGTLNNLYNVEDGSREDGSYQASKSNPALLYELYKDRRDYDEENACGGIARAFRSTYVEGPGSTAGAADDGTGYALGMGETGVAARVSRGFSEVLRFVNLMGGAPYLSEVKLDVFGFSRGAAAARYFVNCIRDGQMSLDVGRGQRIPLLKWPEDLKVSIRFLGIFDTVAAIGLATNDDNGEVNVHLKTAQATNRIYHLTAGDEYRKNFRLNKNTPGGGDTFELPGAHSDVGGGYAGSGDVAPLEDEETRFFYDKNKAEAARAAAQNADLAPGANAEREAQFIKEGWMTGDEREGGVMRTFSDITERTVTVQYGLKSFTRKTYTYQEQVALNRPWVQLGLSRVALHMMYEAAVAEVDGAFIELPPENEEYQIPQGLSAYEHAIRGGSLSGAARSEVLRNYGHVSMKDGGVFSSDYWGHEAEPNHMRVEYDNVPGKAI